MTDAVLIYPKVGDEAYAVPHMPLSVLSVATAAKNKGYKIRIIDQRIDDAWKSTLKKNIEDGLLCVGISSMTGPQLGYAIEIAKHIKQQYPEIPVVWGGVHVSLLPEQSLKSKLVDIVVLKEGEETFPELLQALKENKPLAEVNGIACRDRNNNCIITEERAFCILDEYATLNYDFLELEQYQKQGQERIPRNNSVSSYTSRGCPFKCTFCYNLSFHKSKWRGISASVVIENFKRLFNNGIRNIILCDEYFFQDLSRARKICEGLLKQKIKLNFFSANCRVDQILRMTDEDIALFSKAGFRDIFIGVESGSLKVLHSIHKGINRIEDIKTATEKLLKFDIKVQFSFMTGIPGESIADIKKTLNLMHELLKNFPDCIVPGAGKFIPFPGTEAYRQAIDSGWNAPRNLEQWADIIQTDPAEWLGNKIGKCAKSSLFISSALDIKINQRSTRSLECLRKIYSLIANFRCRYGFIKFVPEYYLMKSPLADLLRKKKN